MDVFADNEFDSDEHRQVFLPANLHIYTTGEHVPIIERSIRTIKEQVRATLQGIPYTTLPQLMYTSLLERVERTLNNFPPPSEPYSLPPMTLVEGKAQFDSEKPTLPFGTPSYVYTSTDNTMEARATLAIALHESNESGGMFSMSLKSGKRVHINKWQEVSISQDIINCVHTIDKASYSASFDDLTIQWNEGALQRDTDVEENLAEAESMIFPHAHDSDVQNNSTVEESDFSEVDSEQFEFNMNNAYIDNNRPTPNTASLPTDALEEGSNEEEDPDLDMPFLDLVAR